MRLNTKHFGEIEIDENSAIDFPEGIPGFEDTKKFILLSENEENSIFKWLQSVDNPELAFVVISPYSFKPDYDIEVDDSQVEILDIQDVEKVLVYCIVVIPEDIKKISANLKSPILINIENKRGKQVPLESENYQIRHYILDELMEFSKLFATLNNLESSENTDNTKDGQNSIGGEK